MVIRSLNTSPVPVLKLKAFFYIYNAHVLTLFTYFSVIIHNKC